MPLTTPDDQAVQLNVRSEIALLSVTSIFDSLGISSQSAGAEYIGSGIGGSSSLGTSSMSQGPRLTSMIPAESDIEIINTMRRTDFMDFNPSSNLTLDSAVLTLSTPSTD